MDIHAIQTDDVVYGPVDNALSPKELIAYQAAFDQQDGLNEDDWDWFTYGETTVRNWLPYMKELSKLILGIRYSDRRAYKKRHEEMITTIKSMIDSNNLDELNLMIQMGHKLLKDKINNKP